MILTDHDVLYGMPVFGGLLPETFDILFAFGRRQSASSGDVFFRQEDAGNSMFVILGGSVSAWRETSSSSCHIWTGSVGDVFGEMSLSDMQPRSATVRADTPTDVLCLDTKTLLRVADSNPEQFALIYMNIAREISRRLRVLEDQYLRSDFRDELTLGELNAVSGAQDLARHDGAVLSKKQRTPS